MPAWSIAGQAALSSGDNLAVLLATEAIGAGAGLKGFAFTPQPTPLVLSILNNSGQTLTLQKTADNITWLPVNTNGTAVSVPTGTAADYQVAGGLNYRLMNAASISAGGQAWVARG